jgi:hypothetical protein
MSAYRDVLPGLHYHPDDPGAACYANDAPGLNDTPAPCPECGSPDAEYLPHEPGCPSGYPTRDELPAGATLEPWTDDDDAELAQAMRDAEDRIAHRWSMALRRGAMHRARLIRAARLTDDELATAAAKSGLIADPHSLPLNALGAEPREIIAHAYNPDDRDEAHAYARLVEARDRQRELGDIWTGITAARAGASLDRTSHTARMYESSDSFDELAAIRSGAAIRWPIYAAGRAAIVR